MFLGSPRTGIETAAAFGRRRARLIAVMESGKLRKWTEAAMEKLEREYENVRTKVENGKSFVFVHCSKQFKQGAMESS